MDIGVANNKTYKNMYHFTDDFKVTGDEYPSINDNDKINQTIKENPYRSNVEIEGGEIVMQPDLTALFKAQGKKHSGGGMDVLLKPESFIFSDFKDLAFSKGDHKLFELKEGGNFKAHNNTPAEVLKRNVNVKHYNTLTNNLGDPKQDDLSKKSSSLMLEKYIATLGNIAYIQENKKGFPDGLPFFSQGSAPVYDPNKKQDIMESKQYAKYGGKIEGNPYMQRGGRYGSGYDDGPYKYQGSGSTSGYVKPNQPVKVVNPITGETEYLPPYTPPMPNGYGTVKQLQEQMNEFNKMTGQNLPTDYKGLLAARRDVMANYPEFVKYYYQTQHTPINNSLYKKNPALKDYSMNELLDTYQDLPAGKENPLYGNELIDYQNVKFKTQEELDNFIKGRNPIKRGDQTIGYDDPKRRGRFYIPSLEQTTPSSSGDCPCGVNFATGNCYPCPDNKTGETQRNDTYPIPNAVNGDGQGQKRADWQFTPWQKISQMYNWGQYANVKRYMPYRSRYNATYAEPSLLNPEQAVGDAKAMANQQLQALGSLNPILRNAQASQSYGQALNQIPGIRSQYDNQNSQITNQFRQYNNQVRNNESMVNMQNDQQYYQQAVTARANFDNMRQFTANQAMDNVMRDVEANQKLSYNLLTQNQPAYGFDWRTGNFNRNKKDIRDTTSLAPQESFQAMLDQVQKMKASGLGDSVISAILRGQFFKQAAPYFAQQQAPPPFQKKGGKVHYNPYK